MCSTRSFRTAESLSRKPIEITVQFFCNECGRWFEVVMDYKDGMDSYLESRSVIDDNLCPYCNGKGYIDEILERYEAK